MDSNGSSTREALLRALEQFDLMTRDVRVERIEWLSLHSPTFPTVMGRAETLQLLREARESFVNGHFVASLVVALAFIEHSLVEELQLLKLTQGSPSFSDALSIAETEKIFPPDWLARARRLSLRRNSYAHLKQEAHSHTLGARIRQEKQHPNAIMETDAKDAIDLMYNFFVATLREFDLETFNGAA